VDGATVTPPRTGDILHIGAAASVQFGGDRGFYFRVIRVHGEWITYDGWIWLEGYVLDSKGDAVTKRSIFVQRSALRPLVMRPKPTPTVRLASPTNRISRLT
jgi:hypothetical protein